MTIMERRAGKAGTRILKPRTGSAADFHLGPPGRYDSRLQRARESDRPQRMRASRPA
jgi:hypothetical protein